MNDQPRRRRAFGFGTMGGLLVALAGAMTLGCGAGPQVKATDDYRADVLSGSRVVFVPLAVSDDLGDMRTGIILSARTRYLASAAACRRIAESWSAGKVVCLDSGKAEQVPLFEDLERHFALDEPVPEPVWARVREATGAKYAILFRPESVSSSRDSTTELRGTMTPVVGAGGLLATTALVSLLSLGATAHQVKVSDTELSYSVSASLVEMHGGKLLKVGIHSGSDSRKTERDEGYAVAPPAAPILEEIMVALGERVLED